MVLAPFLSCWLCLAAAAQVPTSLRLTGGETLLLSSGTRNNETLSFILENPGDKPAALELLPNTLIPATLPSLRSPLRIQPHTRASLELQWSTPLQVWWVQRFLAPEEHPALAARPANNLFLPGKLRPGWQWMDDTGHATHSIRKGVATISVPGTEEFFWGAGITPGLFTGPSFKPALEWDWMLEAKLSGPAVRDVTGPCAAAVGVMLEDGHALYLSLSGRPGSQNLVSFSHHLHSSASLLGFNGNSIYLRLRRGGTAYSCEYSQDGVNWKTSASLYSLSSPPVALFFAVNTWDKASAVSYTCDYLSFLRLQ